MKIVKVTATITMQLTKEEFSQLITVASAARSAALFYGSDAFDDDQIYRITEFYESMKNIQA